MEFMAIHGTNQNQDLFFTCFGLLLKFILVSPRGWNSLTLTEEELQLVRARRARQR